MSIEILPLVESCYPDAVEIFNRENADYPLVAPLTLDLFVKHIASKTMFDSQTSFVAAENGKAVGFALGCVGSDKLKSHPEPGKSGIDGLFFPRDRLRVGDALIEACVEALKARGAHRVYGFASWTGYPFWRGIYTGSEPVCLTEYVQMWTRFMAHGFTHHQQSFTYLGPIEPYACRADFDYELADQDISSPWAQESWRGLRPRCLRPKVNGESYGRLGIVDLPLISERRGIATAGIWGMWVEPQHRRKGVATAMVGRGLELMKEEGTKELIVGTTVENFAARGVYEKAGLRNVAYRTGTYLDLA